MWINNGKGCEQQMKDYLHVFSSLFYRKVIQTVCITIAALGIFYISCIIFCTPAEALAGAGPGATGAGFYLPTYFSAPGAAVEQAGQPEKPVGATAVTAGTDKKAAFSINSTIKTVPTAPTTGLTTSNVPAVVAGTATTETAVTASAVGLLNLKAPARVTAGEKFVLSLQTKDGFPLLPGEDAAFFESCDGEEPQLVGICTLDATGTARLQLQKTKAGFYSYSVLAGPFQDGIAVTVLPGKPAALFTAQKRLFLEAGSRAAAEFSVEDAYGNKVAADRQAEFGKQLAVLISGPDDKKETPPSVENFSIAANPAGNFVIKFTADIIGDYIVKATLPEGGVSAHSIVCARELGAVTDVDLAVQDGKEPFLRLSKDPAQPGRLELGVVFRGENNITKTSSPAEERNIIFSTDRPDLLRIEKTAGSSALLTEKGKGGLANVTVSYIGSGKGLQKSMPIYIAGDPVKIKAETIIDDLIAWVELTLADQEGRPTWEKAKGYRLDTPAGLKVAAQNYFDRGKAEFVLNAEKYGCYNVGITAEGGLSHNLQLVFLKKPKPAQQAVLFIGQESYIKDGQPAKVSPAPETCFGRVFVPVEFLYDAFGVEVSIFPRLKKITLQSPDGTEIIIDGTALQLTTTNTQKGSTVITPIGTLFLQEKTGTYFVPAGIIARILGLEVDYLPKRNQIEHVTFIRR